MFVCYMDAYIEFLKALVSRATVVVKGLMPSSALKEFGQSEL